MKKSFVILLLVCLCASLCACKSSDYNKALSLFDGGEYESALILFESLENYSDSVEYVKECKYNIALKMVENGEHDSALNIFSNLGDYKDSAECVKECKYNIALEMIESSEYDSVMNILSELGEYKDCLDLVSFTKWNLLYQYISNNGGTISFQIGNSNKEKLYLDTNDNGSINVIYEGTINMVFDIKTKCQLTLNHGDNQAEYLLVAVMDNSMREQAHGSVKVAAFSPKMSLNGCSFEQTVIKPNGSLEVTSDSSKAALFVFVREDAQTAICENLPLFLKKIDLGISTSDLGFSF